MTRIAYVNGRYVRHKLASVHIEDRGYQFGDGIYEVILILNKKLIDSDGHLKRLNRSLNEIELKFNFNDTVLKMIINKLIDLNLLINGIVYIQITRGVASRDHKFPKSTNASLVITSKHLNIEKKLTLGKSAITVKDERWKRRDIKTIQLLPNCIAKEKASRKGAYEAIMVMPDGKVSEGSSSNVWIVSGNKLITRNADFDILNGITRRSILNIATKRQFVIEERPFDILEMMNADEVFLTSATSLVTAITEIDGKKIKNGKIGNVSINLRNDYLSNSFNF